MRAPGKVYEIRTVRDLLSVPPEAIDECLSDLRMWYAVMMAATSSPESFRIREDAGLCTAERFLWRDDGLREAECRLFSGDEQFATLTLRDGQPTEGAAERSATGPESRGGASAPGVRFLRPLPPARLV